MKYATLLLGLALVLAAIATARASQTPAGAMAMTVSEPVGISLPKKLHGKWCATDTATGGGSPRFWEYERSKDRSCPEEREDARLNDEDMVLGARTHNNFQAIAGYEWKEENLPDLPLQERP